MALSNNANCTVKQFPRDIYHNLKTPMFYVLTGKLILIASIQSANAGTCAPDVKYLLPQIKHDKMALDYINKNSIEVYISSAGGVNEAIADFEEELSRYKQGLERTPVGDDLYIEYSEHIKYDEEMLKQFECRKNGGQIASSSSDFDVNGNYKGTSQQASNKKSKSGKGNNQEQVASANSNENNTNNADSNNPESSDAKSKGKEFAKDEKRLHADACVAVRRDKNKVPAFKNICPYPIEVVWCSDSKEDPNQCDRGWYGQWNFGVGHSEPINATSVTHWKVAACKGEDSLYMNEELKRNRKVRCVNWKN